jgi:DNA-binding transcriptional regulator LsrR (DeoR family)
LEQGQKDLAAADNFDRMRKIHRILVMHYVENLSQAEIAKRTGISHPTINRLVKEGHERGFVEINIRSPMQQFFDYEKQLVEHSQLTEALVTGTTSDLDEVNLATVGQACADYLLSNLKDGDTICVSGGRGVDAVIAALRPTRRYDVTVVPATGGLQGNFFTDVNHLAAQLARKLKGRAYQVHAPVFAQSEHERDVLMSLQSVHSVLERARKATIALVGIGSVNEGQSTYHSLRNDMGDPKEVEKVKAPGELIAHLINADGSVNDYVMNNRIIGLSIDEFRAVPLKIGISAGPHKINAISGILKGGFVDTLATDEKTAVGVLARLVKK